MVLDTDNRFSLDKTLEDFFCQCEKLHAGAEGSWCFLVIDIDNFKVYNSIYGRQAGSALLRTVDKVLREFSSERPCVTSYMGRDDFAVFMEYDKGAIDSVYLQLADATSGQTPPYGFRPAIGVARVADDLPDAFDQAVIAASDARKRRTLRVAERTPEAPLQDREEYHTLLGLQDAFAEGRVTFFLQPHCRIPSGEIVGAEALARWIDTDGTMISPGRFIPLLERRGFITDFDVHLWDMVFRWLRSLIDRGITPVPVSINVSQMDIMSINVAEKLCALSKKYKVPAELIKVEITESAYAQAEERVQTLVDDLRSRGFTTLMDDFGSGYSSLNMLENVNIDVIKLDMMFVREQNIKTRRGITIIESIINMAKMIGLPIVVEGVETREQVSFLKNLGCRYAQGAYFHDPMPSDRFEELLCRENAVDHRGFRNVTNEELHVREFLDENTFTDTMLNRLMGAVAFYSLEGEDLSITRFNQQFYAAIGDPSMDQRQCGIQNYVVQEDRSLLYKALEDAWEKPAAGGICEIRFYKADNSVFWFRMHFFFLKNEQGKRIYFGQIQDITEERQQSTHFFEALRQKSETTLVLNLDQHTIQRFNRDHSLYQLGIPALDYETSLKTTCQNNIEDEEDRRRFAEFFRIDRLRAAYSRAIYHETITVRFRLQGKVTPVEFSTYYIRHSKDQDLMVYVFTSRKEEHCPIRNFRRGGLTCPLASVLIC